MSGVLISQLPAGLQFDNQLTLDKEIGKELTEQGAIFVKHSQWMLLFDADAPFPKPMDEGIFVDLLEMAMSVITMDRERDFADGSTMLEDLVVVHAVIL